ncbi:MAG: hypothetical protein Ct9H90mP5_10320 [Acidimicrobiaceae bacterium]|nr:MAG: hypothetical protein Ct9H90mP5_10320 [Acidimicrobiaceae bacterium]
MGSRQVAVGGEGVKNASLKIVENAKSIAAINSRQIQRILKLQMGVFSSKEPQVKTSPGRSCYFQLPTLRISRGYGSGSLDTTILQEVPNFSFPSGAYACVIEIDRQTGDARIRDMYLWMIAEQL